MCCNIDHLLFWKQNWYKQIWSCWLCHLLLTAVSSGFSIDDWEEIKAHGNCSLLFCPCSGELCNLCHWLGMAGALQLDSSKAIGHPAFQHCYFNHNALLCSRTCCFPVKVPECAWLGLWASRWSYSIQSSCVLKFRILWCKISTQ